jgi:quercetin dioxygenase-like cupin family protein
MTVDDGIAALLMESRMTNGRGVIHRPSAEAALRILLGERDCDGSLGAVEMAFAPGDTGPPLHVHPTHAEAFYVLAGDLSLQVGDEVVTGGPGTWACAPKNVPHTLANLGAHAGRVLCLFAPGGFERRFERMLAQQHGEGNVADLAELTEAERLTRLVGPPIQRQQMAGPG